MCSNVTNKSPNDSSSNSILGGGMKKILTEELAFIKATQTNPELDGKQWERIYARCIDAQYSPSNRKIIDVEKENVGYSLKTIKTSRDIGDIKNVRIIQCRPDPRLIKVGDWRDDPQGNGNRIIQDWNRQIKSLKESFSTLKEVVLIRAVDFNSFCLCEYDIKTLDEAEYSWKWNKRGNLEGYNREGRHCFTWQHGGSQWTVIKPVSSKTLIQFDPDDFKSIKKSKREILKLLGYSVGV